jgi:hypothetical protein
VTSSRYLSNLLKSTVFTLQRVCMKSLMISAPKVFCSCKWGALALAGGARQLGEVHFVVRQGCLVGGCRLWLKGDVGRVVACLSVAVCSSWNVSPPFSMFVCPSGPISETHKPISGTQRQTSGAQKQILGKPPHITSDHEHCVQKCKQRIGQQQATAPLQMWR